LDGVDHGIIKSASGSEVLLAACVSFTSGAIGGLLGSSAAAGTAAACAVGARLGFVKLAAMSSADNSKTASLGSLFGELAASETGA
jgi:hypothetical protein